MFWKKTLSKTLAHENKLRIFGEIDARLSLNARKIGEMSLELECFHLISRLGREVFNGGVEQYLGNSTGNRFQATLNAFHMVEAEGALQWGEQVNALFLNGQAPENREVRIRKLAELEEALTPATFEARMTRLTDDLTEMWPEIVEGSSPTCVEPCSRIQ